MTKRIVPVILLICLFLTACGGAKTLDVAAFGQKALTDLSFDDEMNPMPEICALSFTESMKRP